MGKTDIRVGVLVPASNSIHEAEFARLKPEGVSFKFKGFTAPQAGGDTFCIDLTAGMAPAMKELTDWGAQLILIGCTTASMKCADPKAAARFDETAGVPVVTAASAVREAIAFLKAKSLSVATPYSDGGNKVVADFLAEGGIKVAGIAGLGFDKSPELWREKAPALTPQELLDFSLTIAPDADGLFLPCTGINSLDALRMYEERTGKLGLSSVQAGYWVAMRRLGVDGRRSDAGTLVSRWAN